MSAEQEDVEFISEYFPQDYVHLLPDDQLKALVESHTRSDELHRLTETASINTEFTASDFVTAKVNELRAQVNHIEGCKSALQALVRCNYLPHIEIFGYLDDLRSDSAQLIKELLLIKQQRKFIEEDMESDVHPGCYHSAMRFKMEAVSNDDSDRNLFLKLVDEWYIESVDISESFCHVVGLCSSKNLEPVRLIPKNLEQGPIAHLFGVESIIMGDPRNGLMLHKSIAKALKAGIVVIVPVEATSEVEELKWKLVVTNPLYYKRTAFDDVKWEASGISLSEEFLLNGPSARFLYFRYLMTYLILKAKGPLEWVHDAETSSWGAPGRYLRRSMLINLLRRVAGPYIPAIFYNSTTFTTVKDEVTMSQEDEDILTIQLLDGIVLAAEIDSVKYEE
ncbi:uncharacterized protein GIQ15_04039 [Arthroderma uncinatum]|uniref:uncharacterized protein n=1 Tax=Arthroderma uncinatum TaxID=74035 RepID=UPI00144A91D0|nr:uncharacterized protein GIQ15_04039 [Arthroderma uncinatum]KAF3481280.1 hypothetical protein GIQ15_04039 [Arthroderma uncinatum]